MTSDLLSNKKHPADHWVDAMPCRILTVIAAFAVMLIVLVLPQWFGNTVTNANQSMLSILMLGASAGFVYGFGFKPQFFIWRILFSPYCAWICMLLGSYYFLSA